MRKIVDLLTFQSTLVSFQERPFSWSVFRSEINNYFPFVVIFLIRPIPSFYLESSCSWPEIRLVRVPPTQQFVFVVLWFCFLSYNINYNMSIFAKLLSFFFIFIRFSKSCRLKMKFLDDPELILVIIYNLTPELNKLFVH